MLGSRGSERQRVTLCCLLPLFEAFVVISVLVTRKLSHPGRCLSRGVEVPNDSPLAEKEMPWHSECMGPLDGGWLWQTTSLGGGGNSNIFVGSFIPKIGEDEPILTHIFWDGLVQQPTSYQSPTMLFEFIRLKEHQGDYLFLVSLQLFKVIC